MSSNQVITSKVLRTVTKGGKPLALGAATKTSQWTRPDSVAEDIIPGFQKAVEADKQRLPEGTAKLIARLVVVLCSKYSHESFTEYWIR